MLKVCSWDIGLKHLAYCILSYNPDSNIQFPIYKWDIIDLVSNDIIPCSQSNCSKPSIYSVNNINYCGTHINKYTINNIKCSDCANLAVYKINNKYACAHHYQSIEYQYNVQFIQTPHANKICTSTNKTCTSTNCTNDGYYDINGECDICYLDKYKVLDNTQCTSKTVCSNKSEYYVPKRSIIYGYCKNHKMSSSTKPYIKNTDKDLKCFCQNIAGTYNIVEIEEQHFCKEHVASHVQKIDNYPFYQNNKKKIACLICNKKSAYYSKIDNIGYCSMHKKKIDISNDVLFNKYNGLEICYKCSKKSSYKYNMVYACCLHKNEYIIELKRSESIVSILCTNKMTVDEIRHTLILKLDSVPELLTVDHVVIENQPALKNPTMKSIGSTIYAYFLIRGIIDKQSIKIVKYINPSNKLKINENNTKIILEKTTADKKYKMTKQLGIEYCTKLITHDPINTTLLQSFKKKDDLADAMLQGAYYLLCL